MGFRYLTAHAPFSAASACELASGFDCSRQEIARRVSDHDRAFTIGFSAAGRRSSPQVITSGFTRLYVDPLIKV
jgi:hypothetical protein